MVLMVSYARSTYEKAKQFNDKLREIQKTVPPALIRTYLAAVQITKNSAQHESEGKHEDKSEHISGCTNKSAEEVCAQALGLTDEQIAQIDELMAIRKAGIQGEMRYALAQAKKNGIELTEEIVSGESLLPGCSRELLDKVPSLGVYSLFMLFTAEEFK